MTRTSTQRWRVAAPRWLKRLAIAFALAVITLRWLDTRIAIVRLRQFRPDPVLPTTYMIYHSMAIGLTEGRVGQVDLAALQRQANRNPWAPYERVPPETARWVSYYTLDIGYSFIVEAARLVFRTLPDNQTPALALQLVADAALVVFVWFLFSEWSVTVGLLAAFLYSSNQAFYELVSFPYYYYWDVPLTFFVLGMLVLAYRRTAQATRCLTLAALALGFGVWLRASWWPLSLFLCGVAMSTRTLRKSLLVPVIAFAILATPQAVRSSLARGYLAFTTRAVWHVSLVGLGYYPNPYGLEPTDEAAFKLTKDKYGVAFRSEDYWIHDQAAKKEFLSIWQKDRGFVIRSFFGRLKESLSGSTATSVRSFLFLPNLAYSLICWSGFVAMMLRGGERRLLGIAAAGSYALYVVLTCMFYFVGLAYDSVSEVTLFVLFMGAIDSALHASQPALRVLAPVRRPTWLSSTGGATPDTRGDDA